MYVVGSPSGSALGAAPGSSRASPQVVPSSLRQFSAKPDTAAGRGLDKALGYGTLGGSLARFPLPVQHRQQRQWRCAFQTGSSNAASLAHPAGPAEAPPPLDFGFPRDLEEHYSVMPVLLGSGGNASVQMVLQRASGEQFACKAVRKALPPGSSDKKRAGHAEAIRNEVEAMRRLSGSLNVVRLEDVFEDDQHVFIIMEVCKGGELWHRIGDRHYSERTVASYMRAVLRTLAQCHSHHLLHRDIKPGNFMLLTNEDRSPLKAIDFGLAVPFEPDRLPRSDLGLEGTPWYQAPEVLSSQVLPASDVWSAGVMAHELLTGWLPFDDHRNPHNASISAVWRSVLTDELDFSNPRWDGISETAKDFVKLLLNRDPSKRPTAKDALAHPWLAGGTSQERSTGKALRTGVVQRIQLFAQGSKFKRSVLQLIAEELLKPLAESTAAAGIAAAAGLPSPGGNCAVEPYTGPDCRGSSSAFASESAGLSSQATPSSGAAAPAGPPGATDACATLLASPFGRELLASPLGQLFLPQQQQDGGVAEGTAVDSAAAGRALQEMGYRLAPSEVDRLMKQVDLHGTGVVERAQFAASQIDWRALQTSHKELWLHIAESAFSQLDADEDGLVHVRDVMHCLEQKLTETELQAAVRRTLEEAGADGELCDERYCHSDALDFDGFLELLRARSSDSLSIFEDRYGLSSPSSASGSHHGGALASSLGHMGSGDWSVHSGGDRSRHGTVHGMLYPIQEGVQAARPIPSAPSPHKAPAASFNFSLPASKAAEHKGGGAPVSEAASDAAGGARRPSAPSPLPQLSLPLAVPGSTGARLAQRGGGHFDARHHGSSLYTNNLVRR